MKQSDLDLIMKVLNEGDIEDLRRLKEMISNILNQKQQKRANIYEVLDVLKLDLRVFLYGELDRKKFRSFKVGPILTGIRKIKNYEKPQKVLVYDLLGIEKNELMLQPQIGSKTLEILEDILNKYGLSITRPLTSEEKAIFYSSMEESKAGLKAI